MLTLPEPKKRLVIVVEDHPMFREQLRLLIDKEDDLEVCGEADNVTAALALIQQEMPHLVVIDITLKNSGGLDLLKDLRAHGIDLPVLVLSMHDESLYAERALRAGARGYITKQEASAKVMTAIRQVLSGDIYLDPVVMRRMMHKVVGQPHRAVSAIERLTDRELDVFALIGEGRTTREISTRLCVGLTTVDTYRARIKEKLGLENAAQLHSEATRWLATRTAALLDQKRPEVGRALEALWRHPLQQKTARCRGPQALRLLSHQSNKVYSI